MPFPLMCRFPLQFAFFLLLIAASLPIYKPQKSDDQRVPFSSVASSAEGNALFSALKRVFMSSPPTELFKNLTRITFYRHVPPQAQVINLPGAADEETVLKRDSAKTPPLNFTTAQTFHSAFPRQTTQFSAICSQPQQMGNGPYRIPRWFFNPSHSRCELFYWSGCCGNANNFQTMEQCQKTCEGMPLVNPCAFGTGQFLFCKPSTAPGAPCPGQQFCHVGDSPTTTICCNKPAAVDACQQPLNVGVGPSNLVRWFFFAPSAQCQSFTYKGLQGNENNFLSRFDCEQICQANPCAVGTPLRDQQGQIGFCSATQQNICPIDFYCHVGGDVKTSLCCPMMAGDPCSQPVNSGFGYYKLQRWFWDSISMECKQFIYCGQKGNQNNFVSQQECEMQCQPNPCQLPVEMPLQQCVPEPDACDARPNMYCHVGASPVTTVCCPAEQIDPCVQSVEQGIGPNQLERFAFDVQAQQCVPFAYRGLKGNRNNFLSQEECEVACLPNSCPSGSPFVGADGRAQSCAVSTAMSTCPNGYWCHVGANAATTMCCPEANANPCQLPMSTGEGPFRLDRFYFDLGSKSCKSFIYKGLKGNQNNFLSLRACQLSCLPLDNPCIGQPAKSTSGQVFFCSASNRDICPVNFWCHLGAVPETTVCCPGATNPCSVPLSPGTGNAGLARWYYNADERQCVSFQYNGKRGNQNNFLTQDECQLACPAELCLLSIDRGSCGGRQTRYAFDRQKSQCVPFEYSGCGGNLNNFLTMQECQQICGNVRI
ncbi:hypothetical protein niasHT_001093 [Heterodera trifolii]|uniref:BPTI/Kunitz inhibitor domain-containing protein n=1 Tax=Heterodera trifolii TaxID=157864 RepID=A0ABD2LVQ2_9BILA